MIQIFRNGELATIMKSDGYYFRDESGDVHGPMSKSQFERAEKLGCILPGTKVWRTQGGAVFQVQVSRRFLPANIFSKAAGSSFCDLLIVFIGLAMLIFVFSLPQLQADLKKNMRTNVFSTVFFFLIVLVTIVLTYMTIKQKSSQLSRATTAIEHSEV